MTSNSLSAAADRSFNKFFSVPMDAGNTGTVELPLADIADYRNHTFKVTREPSAQWNALVESIEKNGVQQPILVRKVPGKDKPYECISGHRRKLASLDAGKTTIPAIITDLTDEQADLLMVSTNTCQRTTWLPSEKARSWALLQEVLSHRGKKGADTAAELEKISGENIRTVQRFIKLTKLLPELMEMVDRKEVTMQIAYNTASLDERRQHVVLDLIKLGHKLTLDELNYISEQPQIEVADVIDWMDSKPEVHEKTISKHEISRITDCFPVDFPIDARTDLIERLLREYFKKDNS